ncbi:hypothetical protein GMA10_06300 [Kocuria koreensis]|jgi:hypothetical protein|uniref:Uncharacterized protein n=1 Tax=Rothia koreensis TaxID=592378 RepID=A0A7K1LI12_9MICC|nr:hypothetical protein [Rothia koreensis]MUN54824.1 hypothetical protein [Rothia koreensis]
MNNPEKYNYRIAKYYRQSTGELIIYLIITLFGAVALLFNTPGEVAISEKLEFWNKVIAGHESVLLTALIALGIQITFALLDSAKETGVVLRKLRKKTKKRTQESAVQRQFTTMILIGIALILLVLAEMTSICLFFLRGNYPYGIITIVFIMFLAVQVQRASHQLRTVQFLVVVDSARSICKRAAEVFSKYDIDSSAAPGNSGEIAPNSLDSRIVIREQTVALVGCMAVMGQVVILLFANHVEAILAAGTLFLMALTWVISNSLLPTNLAEGLSGVRRRRMVAYKIFVLTVLGLMVFAIQMVFIPYTNVFGYLAIIIFMIFIGSLIVRLLGMYSIGFLSYLPAVVGVDGASDSHVWKLGCRARVMSRILVVIWMLMAWYIANVTDLVYLQICFALCVGCTVGTILFSANSKILAKLLDYPLIARTLDLLYIPNYPRWFGKAHCSIRVKKKSKYKNLTVDIEKAILLGLDQGPGSWTVGEDVAQELIRA